MEREFDSLRDVYHKLLEVCANEERSPELLEYEEYVIECITEQIRHMDENIRKCADREERFSIEQHRLELERLRFVINKYLRIRLTKIEKYSETLIRFVQNDQARAKQMMSLAEIKYLDTYFMSIENYLGETILGKLEIPIQDRVHNFSQLDLPQTEQNRFNTTYVLIKANNPTNVVVESDDSSQHESVSMDPGTIHFLPYSTVRHHILKNSGDVELM